MKRTDSPKVQYTPFAINGQREDILPTTPSGDNTASYDVGFPPITMILKSAGGLPPKGQDMNQILYELASLSRWASTGTLNPFDPTLSTAIGGYPTGAMLLGNDGSTIYISIADNNTSDPNTGSATWRNLQAYIVSGYAPITRKVNNKQLNADITLTSSDVGAVPTTRQINNKPLNADITLSASDVGAVPTTRQVNGKALSSDITLTSSDVNAVSSSGGNYPSATIRMAGVETLPTEPLASNLSALYSAPSPINSGDVASGVVNNWYTNQAIYGLIRNASTGIICWGIKINGTTRFQVDPSGNVYSNSDKLATETLVRQTYVQDVRLGSESTAAPSTHTAGFVLTAFDAVSGGASTLYWRPVQKLINGTWTTVAGI
jgi:hypothetical protein